MKAFLEDKDEAFAEAHQRALEWTDDFAIYAEKKCVETLQRSSGKRKLIMTSSY